MILKTIKLRYKVFTSKITHRISLDVAIHIAILKKKGKIILIIFVSPCSKRIERIPPIESSMKIITQRIGMRHTSCNFLSMHMPVPSSSFNHHTFIVEFDFGVTSSSITTNISPHTILFAPESKVLIFIPKKKCELITCVLTPTKFHRRN